MWGGSPLPNLSSSWTYVHIYLKSDKPDIKSFCSRLYLDNLTSIKYFRTFIIWEELCLLSILQSYFEL